PRGAPGARLGARRWCASRGHPARRRRDATAEPPCHWPSRADRRPRLLAAPAGRYVARRRVHLPGGSARLGKRPGKGEGGRGRGRARPPRGARHPPRPRLRPPRRCRPDALRHVAPAGAVCASPPQRDFVIEPATALVWVRLAVPLAPAVWAGLLALGEEAAVGEALHTLGDAPPASVTARVPRPRDRSGPTSAGRSATCCWASSRSPTPPWTR